jgi:hypothetical protein
MDRTKQEQGESALGRVLLGRWPKGRSSWSCTFRKAEMPLWHAEHLKGFEARSEELVGSAEYWCR